MFRSSLTSILVFLGFQAVGNCCSCIGVERACELLRSDAVFVGRVIETVPVKHPLENNSYTFGYSMRFAVDESLRGDLGTEVKIETGSGGGDCGTPLSPSERFLIFAYKVKDGTLWTGMCSGNRRLTGDPSEAQVLDEYRSLTKKNVGSIFGRVVQAKAVWRGDEVVDSEPKPAAGITLHASSEEFNTATKTKEDGSYEFNGLPNGKYTVVPDMSSGLDFDHEYEDRYQADLSNGQCANVSFQLLPKTRIRGHVTPPHGVEVKKIEVEAIPTGLPELNQFSGKWDITDEKDRFDLWPLPPGDYYVGVNISPKAATIVHLDAGEVKDLELPLPETAKPRTVHFLAIGLDGKPLQKIYIQLEDLRHPGDAATYVNVDLDSKGAGTMTIYAGYSYHLHGSHWVSYGNDWCAKPVLVPAGTEPVQTKFVMDRKDTNCELSEIDKLNK